jgi:hypothetical protein
MRGLYAVAASGAVWSQRRGETARESWVLALSLVGARTAAMKAPKRKPRRSKEEKLRAGLDKLPDGAEVPPELAKQIRRQGKIKSVRTVSGGSVESNRRRH